MKTQSVLARFGPLIRPLILALACLVSASLVLSSNAALAEARLAPLASVKSVVQNVKLASNVDPIYLSGVRAKRFIGLTDLKKSLQADFGVRVKRVLAITVIEIDRLEALELTIEDRRGNIYTLTVDAISGAALTQ